MKKLNKILSVGLSLAMCVSMVAPAFAASFDDLQQAVNGGVFGSSETGFNMGNGRYGYGEELAENKYEIEAWNDGDTRRVELNADVELDKDGDDADRTNGGIWVWRSDKEVSIELNGHDIDMNPDAVLDAEEGKFYQVDENGEKTDVEATDLYEGTVIRVTGGANLTITDSEGTGKITGGNAGYVSRYPDGAIKSYEGGTGAVYVDQNSSFTMEGGSVSGNLSQGPAICAENIDGAKGSSNLNVTLKGVTVDNNYTEEGGTIYFRAHAGTVNAAIEDCTITGNVAEGDAIDLGIYNKGQSLNATITNTTITGNRVDKDDARTYDHGGVALWQGKDKDLNVTFDGCTIQNNEGGCTGIYYQADDNAYNGLTIKPNTNTICGNGQVGNEGTSVTYYGGDTLGALHTDAYWEELGGTVTEATCMAEGSISYTCPFCANVHTVELEINPDNHSMGEWRVSIPAQPGVEGEERRDCVRGCGYFETRPIDALPVPVPVTGDETEIEDVEVPLAGIFTRADAIGYLWEKSGKPEAELSTFADVPEDHYWAVAIGWAQDMGIAVADEDGNFRPDDLVLRSTEDIEGEFQEFLNRYAVYAGIKLDEGELFIELAGAADDVIMGEEAQAIFNDFFAKLAAALAQAA